MVYSVSIKLSQNNHFRCSLEEVHISLITLSFGVSHCQAKIFSVVQRLAHVRARPCINFKDISFEVLVKSCILLLDLGNGLRRIAVLLLLDIEHNTIFFSQRDLE
jgi:hypothetical protein